MLTDPAPDAELLARHAAGDPQAFATLVHRHRDRLWAVALRTAGNPEDAADALQDALLSAFRAAAGFRGDAQVTTWLHRIVVNACLDLLRRRSTQRLVPLPAEDGPQRGVLAAPDDLARRELSTDIEAALRTLPDEQRAAIVLVDVQGYPVQEAAAILGVPSGTVKSRCARGRARLVTLLDRPSAQRNHGAAASVTSGTETAGGTGPDGIRPDATAAGQTPGNPPGEEGRP